VVECTPELPGLSPVSGKRVVARFDGGEMSSDGGLLLLREVEGRIGLADRLAGCLIDARDLERVRHSMADILRFRMLMIAGGYEDGNDATSLRRDPIFKMATERLPSEPDLCSQPTISRMENAPDVRALLRMAGALVEQYTGSFTKVPKRIVLDVDDTFDAVHGHQQLRLFNAHYDDYGFQPILVFDDAGRLVAAMIRPAKRPNGRQVRAFLRRLVRRIRSIWPRVEILVRGDSHYACPEAMAYCEANKVDYIFGLGTTSTLRRHVEKLEASTAERFTEGHGGKVRRCKEFYDAAASWDRARRIIARVEVGPQGTDTRFIVTNLKKGMPRGLYESVYCRRGQAENHIKAFKTHLAADRTSCSRATANQMRLFLHAAAYWLLWTLRTLAPKRSQWRKAQFDTIRLRLLKVAAKVTEYATRVVVQLPSAYPDQAIARLLGAKIPQLTAPP
jgi:hypothetical protein